MLRVTDRSASVEAALIDDVVDRQPGAELIYADWLEDAGRAEDAALWRSPPADTVDALSLAQQRYLPVWRNAWRRIGLAADPTMDRALVEGLIGEVYRAGGLEPPAIYVYLDSPLRGVVGAWLLASGQVYSQVDSQVHSQVHSQVRSQVYSRAHSQVGSQTWRACYGSHDAGWLSYYSFFLTVRRLPCCERLLPLIRLARRVGWWWPFAEAAIVTPRPSRLVMRRRRLVEIEYPDGWGFRADHE